MEDKKINFEESNKIAQKYRSYWHYQGRLENHIKLTNKTTLMKKEVLNRSSIISHSYRTIQ